MACASDSTAAEAQSNRSMGPRRGAPYLRGRRFGEMGPPPSRPSATLPPFGGEGHWGLLPLSFGGEGHWACVPFSGERGVGAYFPSPRAAGGGCPEGAGGGCRMASR